MFTFISQAGQTLFVRDDAERAEWTQEEMSLDCDFPYRKDAIIETGQRMVFKDPSTGDVQIYEVKQAKTHEPDHFQKVQAESIAISELSDEHIDRVELTNKTPSQALSTALDGTLWNVGTVKVSAKSSGDLSRGSVWQAVLTIRDNWNCYIVPRVTINSSGQITRHLDILSPEGTWNGVRLSVDKNITDPSITIDDSEVATALFGYGGTIVATDKTQENKEVTFAEVSWSQTADHPAKPLGQKFLEDKDATAQYGRNGRPRYGFYQNTSITDPNVLLQKTWETLKTCRYPSVSFEGTITDLYRLGYADQPLRLHDLALVEVSPAGFTKQIQIIKMTTNLLNPADTVVTIGSYIPNIIYISRDTETQVTGKSGGGGGGKNKSKETEKQEFEARISYNNREIELRAWQNDVDDMDNQLKKQDARLTVTANAVESEVVARQAADSIINNAMNNQYTELRGRITVEAGKIEQIVEGVGKDGKVTAASIMLHINNDNTSSVRIKATKINLDGYVTATQLNAVNAKIDNLMTGNTTAAWIKANQGNIPSLSVGNNLTFKSHGVYWQGVTINNVSYHFMGYVG